MPVLALEYLRTNTCVENVSMLYKLIRTSFFQILENVQFTRLALAYALLASINLRLTGTVACTVIS